LEATVTTTVTVTEVAAKKKPTKVTLKALGPVLPMGLETGAAGAPRSRGFTVRPWRMKEEKELAALKKSDQQISFTQYIGMVLATMCTAIGPYDFTAPEYDGPGNAPKRMAVLSQMFLGDIFYIYVYLRCQVIGNQVGMKITCPHCRDVYDFYADLETLDVLTADSIEPFLWSYKLKTPITIRGKSIVSFSMGPLRWSAMQATNGSPTDAQAKEAAIMGAITGVNGDPQGIVLSPVEIQELSKFDLENITMKINEDALGPVMALEMSGNVCKKCGGKDERLIPIDWRYESFFGVSSQ
jgi:hypothetical protein